MTNNKPFDTTDLEVYPHKEGCINCANIIERQRLKAEVAKIIDEIASIKELPAYDYDDSVWKDGKQIRSRTYKDMTYGDIVPVFIKELKKRLGI